MKMIGGLRRCLRQPDRPASCRPEGRVDEWRDVDLVGGPNPDEHLGAVLPRGDGHEHPGVTGLESGHAPLELTQHGVVLVQGLVHPLQEGQVVRRGGRGHDDRGGRDRQGRLRKRSRGGRCDHHLLLLQPPDRTLHATLGLVEHALQVLLGRMILDGLRQTLGGADETGRGLGLTLQGIRDRTEPLIDLAVGAGGGLVHVVLRRHLAQLGRDVVGAGLGVEEDGDDGGEEHEPPEDLAPHGEALRGGGRGGGRRGSASVGSGGRGGRRGIGSGGRGSVAGLRGTGHQNLLLRGTVEPLRAEGPQGRVEKLLHLTCNVRRWTTLMCYPGRNVELTNILRYAQDNNTTKLLLGERCYIIEGLLTNKHCV